MKNTEPSGALVDQSGAVSIWQTGNAWLCRCDADNSQKYFSTLAAAKEAAAAPETWCEACAVEAYNKKQGATLQQIAQLIYSNAKDREKVDRIAGLLEEMDELLARVSAALK